MKATNILIAAILAVIVIACNNKQETTATATPTINELGTQKDAGPFKVLLMTPAGDLKPGNAPFMAHVTKDGQDVTDANVMLDLSMPSMNMDGPHVDLKHTDGNAYEGTGEIMASPYTAKVDVSTSTGKGTAEFNFTVK